MSSNGDVVVRENFEIKTTPQRPKGWGTRHTLSILGFFSCAVNYGMRFNLSLAIVAMVRKSQPVLAKMAQNVTEFEPSCQHLINENGGNVTNSKIEDGEFEWSEFEQGIILGSFFWGYCITQIPGGILAKKFGGKRTLGYGLLLSAIATLLSPMSARISPYCLIFCRAICGLGEGVGFPAMHTIFSSYCPPNERSQLVSFAYAGSQFGTAFTMILGGYLISWGIGWSSLFYVIGAISIVWFILWMLIIHDNPENHPRITENELNYIKETIGAQKENSKEVEINTPWLEIFKSLPFWAIAAANFGHAYGLYMLLTGLPSYLKNVLHFDIKQNSFLSAFPYLINWIMSILLTLVADFLLSKEIFKIVTVRKSFEALAHLGAAICLVLATFTGCNQVFSIFLITFSIALNGGVYAGFVVNHMDIAINHAGILLGICNTFANFCGFIAPFVSGIILNKNPSLDNWNLIFYIASIIYVVEIIFYTIFASGTEQKWNRSGVLKKDKK